MEDSILAAEVSVGEGASVAEGSVVGEGAVIEAGARLEGARVQPGELVVAEAVAP